MLPYCQELVRFVAHIQQWGKENHSKRAQMDGTCPTGAGAGYFGEPGTNVQLHAEVGIPPVQQQMAAGKELEEAAVMEGIPPDQLDKKGIDADQELDVEGTPPTSTTRRSSRRTR